MYSVLKNISWLLIVVLIIGCSKNDSLPKPKAYLSLEYPTQSYDYFNLIRPYQFKVPNNSVVVNQPNQWVNVVYPNLKASVNVTYRPVKGNLKKLLVEAEKLVYEHTIKAEEIIAKDYINKERKVYGKFVEITGNAASQIQFHATDSSKHFIKASLFFYARPNYDSVFPAVHYIKKDMIKMMETIRWEP